MLPGVPLAPCMSRGLTRLQHTFWCHQVPAPLSATRWLLARAASHRPAGDDFASGPVSPCQQWVAWVARGLGSPPGLETSAAAQKVQELCRKPPQLRFLPLHPAHASLLSSEGPAPSSSPQKHRPLPGPSKGHLWIRHQPSQLHAERGHAAPALPLPPGSCFFVSVPPCAPEPGELSCSWRGRLPCSWSPQGGRRSLQAPSQIPPPVPRAGSVVAPSKQKKRIGAAGNKRCSRMVCSPDSAGSALKGNFIL